MGRHDETMYGCGKCPGCGQFCDYPACLPGYVPPPPVPASSLEELLAWAAQWEERHPRTE